MPTLPQPWPPAGPERASALDAARSAVVTASSSQTDAASTGRARRTVAAAASLALAFHALAWGLWRQHAGQGEDARGERVHLSFRTVSATAPEQAKVAPSPSPTLSQSESTHHVAGGTPQVPKPVPAESAADGPVMVESTMDEALQAISAREQQAAAGNAQDPLAINPDAYWPAHTLDQAPQLAGPWQLNESAVPHRAPGQPATVTIAMRLWVSPQGHIDAMQVISADPDLPWIESLLQDIQQTALRPAYQQGRPVAASWLVEWQLDLSASL